MESKKKHSPLILFYFIINIVFLKQSFSTNFDISSQYGVLYDFNNNEVLFEKDIRQISAPSSLTKIMTAYIIFEKLEKREITLDEKFKVSVRAWRQEGSRMFLEPEWKISVDELLKGLLAVSGNDAAIALAEGVANSIEDFVLIMNDTAKKIGMKNTSFVNPTGLYDRKHYTTLEDLTILIRSLLTKYKKYYDRYFSIEEYTFNNIKQKNRNVLLGVYDGTDGIKTGNTNEGGYSIAVSVERKGQRFVSIVNGATSDRMRTEDTMKLLDYAFSQYQYVELYKKNTPILSMNTFIANLKKDVYLYSEEDIVYSLRKDRLQDLKVQIIYDVNFKNVKKGEKIAILRFIEKDKMTDYDLFASDEINNLSIFSRFLNYFKGNCSKIVNLNLF